MAVSISGEGTSENPYVVNDFESFQYVICNYNKSYYLKLGANIDCNDNGDDWEWTTLTANYQIYIDLNGKTIKNMIIKSDNQLFTGSGLKIYNGKILNVFSNSATSIFTSVTLENLSISINATTVKSYIFNSCPIKNCAIYIKSNKLLNDVIIAYSLSNLDLWFDISDMNGKRLIVYPKNIGAVALSDSRIRGKVAGKPYCHNAGDGTYLISNSDWRSATVQNSVIELDTTEMDYMNEPFIFTRYFVNTVVNSDVTKDVNDISSPIRCTKAEMRNADSLNSKGFNVVEVGR